MTQLITESSHFTESSETLLNLLIVNNIENIDFFLGCATTYLQVTHDTIVPFTVIKNCPNYTHELLLEKFGHFRKPSFMIFKLACVTRSGYINPSRHKSSM